MSDLSSFLTTTGRTLSQMALYSPDHPTVKGAIEKSHEHLTSLLNENNELTLSVHEGHLLVNGQIPEEVSGPSIRPFIQLLNSFDLHSMSFLHGINLVEMRPFFQLAYRKDLKKSNTDVGEFLLSQKASHIKVNQVRYTKIGEDETVGGKGEGKNGEGEEKLSDKMKDLPLDGFLSRLIEESVDDPEERKLLFKRVSELIRGEMQKAVQEQTKTLQKSKTVATNERVRTEGVVEAVADGVVVVDEMGHVLMMNAAAEDIYGVKLSACVGKPLWEGVKKEQMVSLARELTVPSDKPLIKEVEVRADKDTQRTLRASTATVQDTSGRVVGMVSILSDVTKQRELNRMQNEFLANVTHDLKAPIHALKLAVEAILDQTAGPVSNEQSKMLIIASRNVDRLNRLINDLLDYTQIQSGHLRIHKEVTEVEPLLKEGVASMDSWSRNRGVSVEYEQKEEVPPIYVDSDRILQVVINLVSNAIKFTRTGGKVTVRAVKIEQVKIEVEDTGVGIQKEDQKRIFDKFVQLKAKEKLDIRGTGIGLSICQGLIEAHKSKLTVQSPVPGKDGGTLFGFILPAVKKASGSDSHDRRASSSEVTSKIKKGFFSWLFSKFRVLLLVGFLLPSSLLARPYWGVVRRVLEGDLVQLKDGTLIRYLGIDAPGKGSSHFSEAVSANKNWVKGKEVQFRYGLQERTVEGVWQVYIFVDGIFVNRELVLDGLALVTRMANDEKYLPQLLKAERIAHRKKRGIWRDSIIDPYPVRVKKRSDFPWANPEQIKKGQK